MASDVSALTLGISYISYGPYGITAFVASDGGVDRDRSQMVLRLKEPWCLPLRDYTLAFGFSHLFSLLYILCCSHLSSAAHACSLLLCNIMSTPVAHPSQDIPGQDDKVLLGGSRVLSGTTTTLNPHHGILQVNNMPFPTHWGRSVLG